VARKSSKVRQESEVEQSKGEDIREECSVPRGKCTAKGRIWGRIIWRKRRANNIESRRTKHRGRI